jgi:nicotinic acid phosphoribosyltransferase
MKIVIFGHFSQSQRIKTNYNHLIQKMPCLCISFGTRKPHSTTKHAIEKQTELAQAAFIYCNDTKNILSMAEKKPNKNLRSTFA